MDSEIINSELENSENVNRSFEERLDAYLQRRGWTLPDAPQAKGAYETIVLDDGTAYLAGHLPIDDTRQLITGCLTPDGTMDQIGIDAGTWCVLNILATLRKALGSLQRITNCTKMTGFIQSDPEYHKQPAILNGACELLVEVFGSQIGSVARSAVGVPCLPLNAVVEIEMIVKYQKEQ